MYATTAVAPPHPPAAFADIVAFRRPRNLLPADGARSRYTLKARGAIYQFLLTLPRGRRREVLVPAYHCPTIVYAIEQAGYTPRYYGVGEDLSIDAPSLLAVLGATTAAVIIINFFGFPTRLDAIADAVRQQGSALVEDCSHSFLYADPLRLAGERGDAAVYALWKLVPSAVGGLVRLYRAEGGLPVPHGRLPRQYLLRLLKRLGEEAVEGLPDGVLRRTLLALERQRVKGRRREVEPIAAATADPTTDLAARYPVHTEDFACALPWLPQHMLLRADLEAIARRRRENYAAFAAALPRMDYARPLFPALPAEVVPWCFPLRVAVRKGLDARMLERGVPLFTFGETLHTSLFAPGAAPARVLEVASSLRDQVLCIGVHQKLSAAALEQAAAQVTAILAESPAAGGSMEG